jgi:hypothetical protein
MKRLKISMQFNNVSVYKEHSFSLFLNRLSPSTGFTIFKAFHGKMRQISVFCVVLKPAGKLPNCVCFQAIVLGSALPLAGRVSRSAQGHNQPTNQPTTSPQQNEQFATLTPEP